MDKFTKMTGVAAPLPIINIDTDMIIPKDYLKTIKRTGLSEGLFAEMRLNEDGSENPDFVLNKPAYREATILVAGDNFGCGSSREHAVWAFEVNDINVIIAQSFARIFRQNMFNCGILALELPEADIARLFSLGDDVAVNVELATDSMIAKNNATGAEEKFNFVLNPFDKELVAAGGWLAYADKKY